MIPPSTCRLLCIITILAPLVARAAETTRDVVIYGGTCAAVTAAVQVKKMGKSVIIVSPDKHIGGLARDYFTGSTSTMPKTRAGHARSAATSKTKAVHHETQTMWTFEPHVAEQTFEDMLRENDIEVHRDEWLDREKGVHKEAARIISITTLKGETYLGGMFIGATYEGDLMAAAGVSYHVRRENNSTYGEEFNGSQIGELHHLHFFKDKISPYRIANDPTSGLTRPAAT
jgi:hypothetical protein